MEEEPKLILIEHNGTDWVSQIVEELKKLLTYQYYLDTEEMIGMEDDEINLYNGETLEKLSSFLSMPSKETLDFLVEIGL